ncbi:MAG: 30S ribosomal protein S20 [Phycisphaerae bacterium]|nr:30S ribosomal protein S20 [Phycisphaerae bacterium]HQL53416.1 30S ribosomal protein S20 [Phycisphaerae bacterium]
MAHSLSSKKRIRQNATRRARNRARRSALRGKLRKCNETLLRGTPGDADAALRTTAQALDRAANQRTLHRNAAARRKSRLARRVNALKQKSAN